MSESAFPSLSSLPPDEALLVEKLCTQFEDAWKKGERPHIEDYRTQVPEAVWPVLLRELLVLEVAYRRRAGERLTGDDYRGRFPLTEEELAACLGKALPASPTGTLPAPTITFPPTAGPRSVIEPPSIPGYEVLGELGVGGMGIVYRARQAALNRDVALKMILSGRRTSPEEVHRFLVEAEAVARMQHPNIVQIFETGQYDGLPYFTLEYVEGGNLARRLIDSTLPARDATGLLQTLARAVHYAHERGIVHRDLKPANVLLTADGTPKIADFGLAKRFQEGASGTRSGAILGTPSYMAPEQADGRLGPVGPATDIYALGAMLYECLTGRPPFKAATMLETFQQVLTEDPVPAVRLQPTTPRDLDTICLKCLKEEPAKRYASAAELADDLGRLLAGKPIHARPVGRMERAAKWVKRNPGVAGSLAGVAAALLVGTAVSTVFGLLADKARGEAEQHAKNESMAKMEAQNEADRARSVTARSWARLLGAHGQTNQLLPPLNDQEINVLEELGETEDAKLRWRFLEEAIRTPVTTRQLRYRTRFAWQAAVGLDARLRGDVERMLVERLAAKDLSPEEAVDLSLCLAALGDVKPQSAREAALILIQAMSQTADGYAWAQMAQGLAMLAERLERKETAALCAQGAGTLFPSLIEKHYRDDAWPQALTVLAAHLDSKEARETVASLCDVLRKKSGSEDPWEMMIPFVKCGASLNPVATKKIAKDLAKTVTSSMKIRNKPFLWPLEVDLLAMFGAHLEPKEAKEMAGILTQAIDQTTKADDMVVYAEALSMVATHMDPKEAAAAHAQATTTLTKAMSQTTTPKELEEMARRLARMAARLEAKQGANLLTQAINQVEKRTDLKASEPEGLATKRGAMKELVAGLVAVASRLESKEAAATLAHAVITTTDPSALRQLELGLRAIMAHMEPKGALTLFTETMTKTTSSRQLLCLWPSLEVAAGRLEPKEAAEWRTQAAATLTHAMRNTTNPQILNELSFALSKVVVHLQPKAASVTCVQPAMILIRGMSVEKDPDKLWIWSECLAKVAANLEPMEAKEVAATLIVTVNTTKDPKTLRWLAQNLANVAAHLDPKEAAATWVQLSATLNEAMNKTTKPDELVSLTRGLASVAAHLEPKATAVLCAQAAATLLQALGKTTDVDELEMLAEGLVALTAHLEPKARAAMCAQATTMLTDAINRTTEAGELGALAEGLVAITAPLGSKESKEAAATLIAAVSKTKGTYALPWLAERLAKVLAARLKPKEAKEVAATLILALSETKDTDAVEVFAECLAAVAPRLEPREAAALLSMAMTKSTETNALRLLALALEKVAAYLDSKEAATTCAQAATILTQAMSKSTETRQVEALARGLEALAVRLDSKGTKDVSTSLIQAMSKTADADQLEALSQNLVAVLSRESAERRQKRLQSASGLVGLGTSPTVLSLSLALQNPALEPPLEPLPAPTLVELLKHPLCIGASRRVVLDQLGRHYDRHFEDQWEFVHFAEEQKLGLDFTSPVQRP